MSGALRVIVGVSPTVYPIPASFHLTAVTIPAELITALAVAVVPTPGPAIVTVGSVIYPEPPAVTVTITSVPSAIILVAAAPIIH